MLTVFSKNGLSTEFGRAFAFSAYIDVAESCRANSMLRQLSVAVVGKDKDADPKIPAVLNSLLGDLYYSACRSLWDLGVVFNLVPEDTFFVFGPDPYMVDAQYSAGEDSLAEKYDPYVPLTPSKESLSSMLSLPSGSSTLSLATVASFSPPSAIDIAEFNRSAAESPTRPSKHRRQPSVIESVNLSDEVLSSFSLSDRTRRTRQASKTPARAPRSTQTHRRQRSADGVLDLSAKLATVAFVSEGNSPEPSEPGNDQVVAPDADDPPADQVTSISSSSPHLGRSRDAKVSTPEGLLPSSSSSALEPLLDQPEPSTVTLIAQDAVQSTPSPVAPLPEVIARHRPLRKSTTPTMKSTHPSLSTALLSPIGFDRVCIRIL